MGVQTTAATAAVFGPQGAPLMRQSMDKVDEIASFLGAVDLHPNGIAVAGSYSDLDRNDQAWVMLLEWP